MEKNPIGEIMETSMQKIREIVDANTIIGQEITTQDGITIIPVSKVTLGFGTGGSDFQGKNPAPGKPSSFGGGSAAGVNIIPVAFLVIRDGNVRLLSVLPPASTTVDRLIEIVPELIDKVRELIRGGNDGD
ncbi:MAG: GerW family sporulation protein [Oscillospiraceae bacterium]|jgi:sporulation protein YtfJ|nr:GerW family sporulation protein [Oscillospiraceae bacterium]